MKKKLLSLLLALLLISSQLATTALCAEKVDDGVVTIAPTCILEEERDD